MNEEAPMINETLPFQVGRYRLDVDFRIEHYIDTEIMDIERHYHEYYECIFFYSGDIAYSVGNRTYFPVPGDVILINVAQIHVPKMQSAMPPYDRISLFLSKWLVRKISDTETDFLTLFEKKDGNLVHLTKEELWAAKTILAKLRNLHVNDSAFGSSLLAKCYITELLITIGRACSEETDAVDGSRIAENRICQVKEYISKNIAQDLSLDSLAATFHLNKYYISHEFKDHTGMSLYSYILKRRLAKASEELRDGHSPNEICSECGFGDVNALNRAFKKEFGLTPRQYVQSFRKK